MSSPDAYDTAAFKGSVSKALEQVKKVMDIERRPKLPEEVHHKYEDKFRVVEYLGEAGVAALLHALEELGMGADDIKKVRGRVVEGKVAATLRLSSEEKCAFIKEEKKKVDSKDKSVTDVGIGASLKRIVSKTTHEVTTWYWDHQVQYNCFVFFGTDVSDAIPVFSRGASVCLEMPSSSRPRPAHSVNTPIDVSITWFMQHLSPDLTFSLHIDRDDDKTRTPRRNPHVESALVQFTLLSTWATSVGDYFMHNLFRLDSKHNMDLEMLSAKHILNPVLPLMEEGRAAKKQIDIKGAKAEDGVLTIRIAATSKKVEGLVLTPDDLNALLAEQRRAIDEKLAELKKAYPSETNDKGLVTYQEAKICLLTQKIETIISYYSSGVDYIERLLRKQLMSAIGKAVTSPDFTKYMEYHNRKLFKADYQPMLFAHSVRRAGYHPDGVISLNAQLPGEMKCEVHTITSTAPHSMHFDLNAACRINFSGTRYVHSYVANKFSCDADASFSITARATQFCSYILALGRIGADNLFLPSHAILVQNKDLVTIPLWLETIPTKKEFEKAIQSISPEMQRFASAFRAMQLESTLFGMAVFQVKPQLEKVLSLPDEALTKEIALCQDLLELMVKYQIPSDLLAYDPELGGDKLETVKCYAEKMKDKVRKEKEKQMSNLADVSKMTQLLGESEQSSEDEEVEPCCDGAVPEYECALRCADEDMDDELECCAMDVVGFDDNFGGEDECAGGEPEVEEMDGTDEVEEDKPKGREEGAESQTDLTAIPYKMEEKIASLGEAACLRPSIVHMENEWDRERFSGLLARSATSTTLGTDELREEKSRAYDFLDTLTKAGLLSYDNVDMHVIIASTHCFDRTLMDTLVIDNYNPIEKVQDTTLALASVVHDVPPEAMINHSFAKAIKE